jgi:hypothetical protein
MWTKSQKISAAVLGLAATAFAVDRFVLQRPAGEAEAAEVTAVEPAAKRTAGPSAASAKPLAQAATPASQATTLANRLAALGEARRFAYETSGDAFRPSDEWLAQALPKEAAKAPEAAAEEPAAAVKKVDYAEEFRSRHSLHAVMTRQSGGMAIIDGKLYAPGHVIDGLKLTKVGDTEATFVGKDTTVTLRLLKQPAGTTSANTATATAR